MKRRNLFHKGFLFLISSPLLSFRKGQEQIERGFISLEEPNVRFYHSRVLEKFRCTFIADTHLSRDDERGRDFTLYSDRMSKAYLKTRHFQTGVETNPEEAFVNTLEIAKKENSSLLILAGDIFSYPSEAAITFVLQELKKIGIPYIFTAGNHDWHYEGMTGSADHLRKTWINNRLLALYQGEHPMYGVRKIHGIRIITLDNSTYEINEDQLDFFEDQLAKGDPILLCVHIPFYVPGRNVGFGCGHPEWNGMNDKNFELEKRERWPESGHSAITKNFYQRMKTSPQIIGILAGHIHKHSVAIFNHGFPQIVTSANAGGGYLTLHFEKNAGEND
jgi:predicted phosphodiesterase